MSCEVPFGFVSLTLREKDAKGVPAISWQNRKGVFISYKADNVIDAIYVNCIQKATCVTSHCLLPALL